MNARKLTDHSPQSGPPFSRPARRRRLLQVVLVGAVLGVICSTDLVVGSPSAIQPSAQKQYIVASGIKGTLVLCGTGDVPNEAIDEFTKVTAAKKGNLVVVRTRKDATKETEALAIRLQESAKAKNVANVVEILVGAEAGDTADADLQQVKQARAIWFATNDGSKLRALLAGSPLGAECQALLNRGGVIAATGSGSEAFSQITLPTGDNDGKAVGVGLLPDTIIMARSEKGRNLLTIGLKENPGMVGIELGAGSSLVATGRSVRSLGTGPVSLHLAASGNRKASVTNLDKKKTGDLTMLRRSAITRADPTFPPAKPKEPVVEKGSLVIVGGGAIPQDITDKFFELAGGKNSTMVVFPQAGGGPGSQDDKLAAKLRKMGVKSATVITGRERDEVETPAFLEAMKNATGVWFHGGRQGKIVDALENTKLHEMMYDVLSRGGVIGGSSAGASIQTEYLVRGSPGGGGNMYEGYERGFNFLPGVAIDQHFAKRKRFEVMTQLMKTYPQFLGIGIDESTAIIVRGHIADVMGKGSIHVYDTTQPVEKGKPDYYVIPTGGRLDLKSRKEVPVPEKKTSLLRLHDPIWDMAPGRVLEMGRWQGLAA